MSNIRIGHLPHTLISYMMISTQSALGAKKMHDGNLRERKAPLMMRLKPFLKPI